MENVKKFEEIQVGGAVPAALAIKFRDYCKTAPHKFDQKQLFGCLVKWWLGLDLSIQEHIYRGRFEEAHRQIAADLADSDSARKIASRTKSRVSKLTQKQEKKSSKAV